MKYLGYILTGVISAAAAGVGTFFVTRHVTTKKLTKLYEASTAEQLSQCRAYYADRIRRYAMNDVIENTPKSEQVMTEEDIKSEVDGAESSKDIVITDTSKPDGISDEPATSYHKMYGANESVKTVIPDVGEDPAIYARERPYLIRRSQFYDEYDGYKRVTMMYFIGDITRNKDNDITYVPVLYSEGRSDVSVIGPEDQEWEERCIKLSEIDDILGQEWKSRFGDDSYDPDTGTGYDYDDNECYVANDKLRIVFNILRDERMYKTVIAGLEPGDDFDYSKVR